MRRDGRGMCQEQQPTPKGSPCALVWRALHCDGKIVDRQAPSCACARPSWPHALARCSRHRLTSVGANAGKFPPRFWLSKNAEESEGTGFACVPRERAVRAFLSRCCAILDIVATAQELELALPSIAILFGRAVVPSCVGGCARIKLGVWMCGVWCVCVCVRVFVCVCVTVVCVDVWFQVGRGGSRGHVYRRVGKRAFDAGCVRTLNAEGNAAAPGL